MIPELILQQLLCCFMVQFKKCISSVLRMRTRRSPKNHGVSPPKLPLVKFFWKHSRGKVLAMCFMSHAACEIELFVCCCFVFVCAN